LNRPWEPFLLRLVAAILMLDLVKYFSHRTMHGVFPLWHVH
jgi:sterol desaturase/sphingolipid hydroxylase (fatty acid hydroxylase superfamily)